MLNIKIAEKMFSLEPKILVMLIQNTQKNHISSNAQKTTKYSFSLCMKRSFIITSCKETEFKYSIYKHEQDDDDDDGTDKATHGNLRF